VDVVADAKTTADLQVRRDWAAYGGGGRIHSFTGTDFTPYGCGPAHAIDQSTATGWSTDVGVRSITVKLPSYVDVRSFAVDPGAVCGDPESASTQGYRIETSKTGTSGSWAVVRTGSFGLGQAHQLNQVPIALRKAVRHVRFTILSNHGHANYMDLAELAVYGTARPSCLGKAATRVGTEGANVLRGGAGADVIVGLGGNDRITGGGGSDLICAGAGSDRLTGGRGRDKFDAGEGNDTIYSRDRMKETTVRGGAGRDRARKDKSDRTSSVERRF
jgi:hypothetical protein